MVLKHKDLLIDRRSEADRRTVNVSLWGKQVERRKRPDRRMSGVNVDMQDIPNDEFLEMFADYLN